MSLTRLLPAPSHSTPLHGTYLQLALHRSHEAPVIYANFIASLDGRISLRDPVSGDYAVPAAIANKRDWRLYQELAAQADIMITSARYFRQLAHGRAQDLLPVGCEPEYADLRDWRQQQGLAAQPDVLILSRSLDIPQAALDKLGERRIIVLTGKGADAGRARQLEATGVEVNVADESEITAATLKGLLAAHGYRSGYMIAGPEVHRTLLAGGGLDHLFLTTRHVMLGGNDFHTLLNGMLPAPVSLCLQTLYLDTTPGWEQSFAHYVLSN